MIESRALNDDRRLRTANNGPRGQPFECPENTGSTTANYDKIARLTQYLTRAFHDLYTARGRVFHNNIELCCSTLGGGRMDKYDDDRVDVANRPLLRVIRA